MKYPQGEYRMTAPRAAEVAFTDPDTMPGDDAANVRRYAEAAHVLACGRRDDAVRFDEMVLGIQGVMDFLGPGADEGSVMDKAVEQLGAIVAKAKEGGPGGPPASGPLSSCIPDRPAAPT